MRKIVSSKKSSPPGTSSWRRMFTKSHSVSLRDDSLPVYEPKTSVDNGKYSKFVHYYLFSSVIILINFRNVPSNVGFYSLLCQLLVLFVNDWPVLLNIFCHLIVVHKVATALICTIAAITETCLTTEANY